MSVENELKFEKPLASATLEQMLIDNPKKYQQLISNGIIAVTGINENERKNALYNLKNIIMDYTKKGTPFIIGSKIDGNMIKIACMFKGAKYLQLITEVPAHIQSYLLGNVVMRISKN